MRRLVIKLLTFYSMEEDKWPWRSALSVVKANRKVKLNGKRLSMLLCNYTKNDIDRAFFTTLLIILLHLSNLQNPLFPLNRSILSQFTEDQMNRYESFRRSGFQKATMKRVFLSFPLYLKHNSNASTILSLSTGEKNDGLWFTYRRVSLFVVIMFCIQSISNQNTLTKLFLRMIILFALWSLHFPCLWMQLLTSVTGTQKISMPMTIVMSGIAKMFVGELVETGTHLSFSFQVIDVGNWWRVFQNMKISLLSK